MIFGLSVVSTANLVTSYFRDLWTPVLAVTPSGTFWILQFVSIKLKNW